MTSMIYIKNLQIINQIKDDRVKIEIKIDGSTTFETSDKKVKGDSVTFEKFFDNLKLFNVKTLEFTMKGNKTTIARALIDVTEFERKGKDIKEKGALLVNNNNMEVAKLVYNFNFGYSEVEKFDMRRTQQEKERDEDKSKKELSTLELIGVITSSENNRTLRAFLRSSAYLETIENKIQSLFEWDKPLETFLFAGILSLLFLYTRAFLCVLPFVVITFHLFFKNEFKSWIVEEYSQLRSLNHSNKTMNNVNKLIGGLEMGLTFLTDSKIEDNIEFYKILIFSPPFILLATYVDVQLNVTLFICLWALLFSKNPEIVNFANYLYSSFFEHTIEELQETVFIKQFLSQSKGKSTILNNLKQTLPDLVKTKILDQEELEYFFYENQRWWLFRGWVYTFIFDEAVKYSDTDPRVSKRKEEQFLPMNSNYVWSGEWAVKIEEKCDDDGWRYYRDFENKERFKSFATSGYNVRRRKWVRLAKLREN